MTRVAISDVTSGLRPLTCKKRRDFNLSAFQPFSLSSANARAPGPRHAVLSRQSFTSAEASREAGFTLLELLIVIGIIILLTALVAPTFTTFKSANDVTSAANSIKGVLDTARTYAMANNTYTWVGFYEEDASRPSTNPATPGTGRLVMSFVAAKDGIQGFDPDAPASPTNRLDGTRLIQLGKLIKIDNVHLPLFTIPSGTTTGDTFDIRPALQNDPVVGYNDSRFGELNSNPTAPTTNTKFPFQYPVDAGTAQYTFNRTLQFNPRGEGRINSTYDVRRVVEIGLLPTHQNMAPTPTPSAGNYIGNVVAVQLNGFNGNVKVYRR